MSLADDSGQEPDPARPDDPQRSGRDDPLDYEARFADIVARWETDSPSGQDHSAAESPRAHPMDPPSGTETEHAPSDDGAAPSQSPAPGSTPHDADGRSTPHDADGGAGGRNAGDGLGPQNTPWRQHIPPPEPDEDFVPPRPAPLPRNDLGFWGAMLGLIVGPLWLIYLVVTDPHGSRLPIGLSLAMTVGGFALVVARLPRRARSSDESDDDGAVV
ncbi:MAG: hypothetical protein Q4P32_04680 [Micrococcales bacterium]|nr:hypothetical protein [Micrococcales bacterium]